ncbi:hypothetical protein KTE13_28900 [Burkholderia multivorans]|uniref:hypothetical protein n=1 Tax=Burkholderia multivorans TaxID=87883 RepID=UPI001C219859|nr:hypothetical protein [Burkholderia multivorans]MBU9403769.1 hypothetical protein [Burkholderia multivorans]
MDELNAAPSSTEPTAEELASIAMGTNAQAAGTATSGEHVLSAEMAVNATADKNASATSQASDPSLGGDAPAVGGGVDAPSHLLLLDAMLAEIERKIATGIHLFAHEVTAARDHLAKLL